MYHLIFLGFLLDLRNVDCLREGCDRAGECLGLPDLSDEVAQAPAVQLPDGGQDRHGVLVAPTQEVGQPGAEEGDALGQLGVGPGPHPALEDHAPEAVASKEHILGVEAQVRGGGETLGHLVSDGDGVGAVIGPLSGGGHPEAPGVVSLDSLHQREVTLTRDGGARDKDQTWRLILRLLERQIWLYQFEQFEESLDLLGVSQHIHIRHFRR